MSEKIHNRALHLIAQARVEGITEADSTWLRAHLEECEFCTGHAQQTDRALRSLRTASIQLPAARNSACACAPRNCANANRSAGPCGWLAPFRGPSVSPVLRMFGACSSGSENVLEYRN